MSSKRKSKAVVGHENDNEGSNPKRMTSKSPTLPHLSSTPSTSTTTSSSATNSATNSTAITKQSLLTIDSLSDEMLFRIFSQLNGDFVMKTLTLVCSRWREVCRKVPVALRTTNGLSGLTLSKGLFTQTVGELMVVEWKCKGDCGYSNCCGECWFNALANCSQLSTLNLYGSELYDLSPLTSETGARFKITKLSIARTLVEDLSPLAYCTNLEILDVGQTSISNISALANLSKLRTLFLNSTKVADISPLASCTKLTELYATQTPLADVSPLVCCPLLQTLHLSYTPISDVTSLSICMSLKSIVLQETLVTDISCLVSCPNLVYLDVSFTRVSDVSKMADSISLKKINVTGSLVTDISLLKKKKIQVQQF